jgi:hypothetical protein
MFDITFAEKYSATLGILVVLLIVSICDLMVSFLLVISAYKQRPNLAKPWLVVVMFSLGIEVIVFISSIAIGDLRVAIVSPIQIGNKPIIITFLERLINDRHLHIIFQFQTTI